MPIKSSGTISGSESATKRSSRIPTPDSAATRSRTFSRSPPSHGRNTTHLQSAPEFPRPQYVPKVTSAPELLTNKEDPDQEEARQFIASVCDAGKASVANSLSHLEAHDLVQIEVTEDLLACLDRFENALKTAAITNQPAVDDVNSVRVDLNKLLEQRSSLRSLPASTPATTDPTRTNSQPTPPGMVRKPVNR